MRSFLTIAEHLMGWHDLEIHPTDNSCWNWTGPQTCSTLSIPQPVVDGILALEIHVIKALADDIYQSVRLLANGYELPVMCMNIPGIYGMLKATIPLAVRKPPDQPLRLTVLVNRTISPHELDPDKADQRKLGIAISRIVLTTPEGVSIALPAQIHPAIPAKTAAINNDPVPASVNSTDTRAARVARQDDYLATMPGSRFAQGIRPVIRWIKGDGLDDVVTRTAIAEATRRFGRRVDYCLCTNGIDAVRVRDILAWAVEPVEWLPVTPDHNPALAAWLESTGCSPDHYGYWWKWFPERVRPHGPEWILDGDMVITGAPSWFDQWLSGQDECRVSQDDRWPKDDLYGTYTKYIDDSSRLYSGLISLPPGLRYMPAVEAILRQQPLGMGHDGQNDKCEQGVIAAAFQAIGATPIPLYEFPFARAFEDHLDYGLSGDQGKAWGYHFGNAFRRRNPHFERLTEQGVFFSQSQPASPVERFAWMKNIGQWGVPGWGMPDEPAALILEYAREFVGRPVLELGSSRGKMSAMLAAIGCRVTTVDKHDRGAKQNLQWLDVTVVIDDALHYLETTSQIFDLIIIDLHGNAPAQWQMYAPWLPRCLARPGLLLLDNATLWKIPEWAEETGVSWYLEHLPEGWKVQCLHEQPLPGIAAVRSS
jgi:hypothetical protein